MCKCCSHGTFPLFDLQSSHLNICYYHQDLHRQPLRPGSRPGFYGDRCALLLIGAWPLPRWPGIGHALKRHPYSGLVDSAGMLSLEPFSEDQGRSAVHPRGIPPISFLAPYGFSNPLTRTHVRLLGPCFKTGRMGSPQADARSTLVPKHAETARAGFHDRGDDVSTGVSKARAWAATTIRVGPSPEPIGGPALAVPHPTGAHRPPRGAIGFGHDGALTLSGAPFQGTSALSAAEDASPDYNSDAEGDRFSSWDIPGSLVVTKGILWARLRRTRTANGGATTDGHLFIPIPWRNSRRGCSFCHGDTGSRVTGTGRGRGAMKRPHPLPLMLDNTFMARSARQVQWTSRDVAGSEPPTSPRSEHFTGPFNRQIAPPSKNGHAPPPIESRKSSQSVNPYYVWTWINQVAFLRDVRPACSSTHYLGRGEAITGQDHRSCRGTKCTSYERPGPRPYAHEIFRIQKHDRASMHRRGRIIPIDTLGTSSTTEVHQAATRSLDEKG
ncbi:hypothetical protein V6N13_022748 [Hibiscus sabdariffa]